MKFSTSMFMIFKAYLSSIWRIIENGIWDIDCPCHEVVGIFEDTIFGNEFKNTAFVHATAYKFVKYIPFQGENARKYVGQETMGGSQEQANGHSNRERDVLRSEKILFTDGFGPIL